jgi:hypothetical protein
MILLFQEFIIIEGLEKWGVWEFINVFFDMEKKVFIRKGLMGCMPKKNLEFVKCYEI